VTRGSAAAAPVDRNPKRWEKPQAARELGARDLRFDLKFEGGFATTEDLAPAEDFAGQERALAALELGLGVAGSRFNIYVSGLAGAEGIESLRKWMAERAKAAPTPGDRVYVHNFKRPDAPYAIYLCPGGGSRLKEMMRDLVQTLQRELPKAFRQEAFDREKALLREKYNRHAQGLNSAFEKLMREKGFLIQMAPGGNVLFIPLIQGKPLQTPEDLARLSPEELEEIDRKQHELMGEMAEMAGKQREIMREMEKDIRLVERHFCEQLLNPLLAAIEHEIDHPKVALYLAEVREFVLDNLDSFKEAFGPAGLPQTHARERDPFLEYDVNVVVDNSETRGAPVLVESSPTYLNLFGTIERVVDRFGRVVTNFTRIKSGSLLRAHGGYLIFNLEDAITEPAVWKVLRRTLRSGRIEMETYEPFALFSASGLKPEPVDIQTKVIVAGSPWLYHLLFAWDEEFREIFRIRADFRPVMEIASNHLAAYAGWAAAICKQEGLPPFDPQAIERLLEFGARSAGDREKILASHPEVADLVREAAYCARRAGDRIVSRGHVDQALESRIYRSNRIEEEIRELITQGTILIDIAGQRVGQVNGLSVLEIGQYAFGRPSRVTASVAMGQAGIVNIERESRLSGSIHDKGVLILAGYLRNRYGQDKPLALSASLCFEQSYSGVEGDSASSAELYALLSRLSNLPLRQDIAVTGSVNQWGDVQAIGGVNEKIEGFFDLCRVQGLTGKQGAIIPAANIRNLILRTDVVRAVSEGKFHIYPVRTIDEGLEILTEVRAGEVDEPGTVNGAVNERLRELAVGLRAFMAGNQPNDAKEHC
jgi:ATP-dependent Lon protease